MDLRQDGAGVERHQGVSLDHDVRAELVVGSAGHESHEAAEDGGGPP